MEKNIDMAECDKEKSYKDKVFEWVCSNAEKLRWVRDDEFFEDIFKRLDKVF